MVISPMPSKARMKRGETKAASCNPLPTMLLPLYTEDLKCPKRLFKLCKFLLLLSTSMRHRCNFNFYKNGIKAAPLKSSAVGLSKTWGPI